MNAFRFGDKIYHQIKGTAMGTPTAPNYANLFLAHVETKMLDEFYKRYNMRPLCWYRYIDDIFFVWDKSESELRNFIDFLQDYSTSNKMLTTLKFDVNISTESVTFLDTRISISENGQLVSDLYSKDTDAHLYTKFSSCHPLHTKLGILKSQFLRIRRICSENSSYVRNALTMKNHFLEREFRESDIDKCMAEVFKLDRIMLLETKTTPRTNEKTPCVVTYSPAIRKLPEILHKNYHIIESMDAFKEPPLVAYKKLPNLKNSIVRSDIRHNIKSQNNEIPKCSVNTPCNKCKMCKENFFIPSNNIQSGKRKFTVTRPGNCDTTNCIFGIHCEKCKKWYVGYTTQLLKKRFSQHKTEVNLIKKGVPRNIETGEHFSAVDHTINDMKITVLDHRPNFDDRQLKNLESFYMCKLKSLQPTGLNKCSSDLTKHFYNLF